MPHISFDMIRGGRVNGRTGAVALVAFGAFVAWRLLTLGTADPSRVIRGIEEELIDDFRQRVYAEAATDPTGPFPGQRLADVAVTFDNVSIAAPLLSWSVMEDVIVRFDYELTSAGVVEASGTRVYRHVTRGGATNVWDSGAIRYYLKHVF